MIIVHDATSDPMYPYYLHCCNGAWRESCCDCYCLRLPCKSHVCNGGVSARPGLLYACFHNLSVPSDQRCLLFHGLDGVLVAAEQRCIIECFIRDWFHHVGGGSLSKNDYSGVEMQQKPKYTHSHSTCSMSLSVMQLSLVLCVR